MKKLKAINLKFVLDFYDQVKQKNPHRLNYNKLDLINASSELIPLMQKAANKWSLYYQNHNNEFYFLKKPGLRKFESENLISTFHLIQNVFKNPEEIKNYILELFFKNLYFKNRI